MERVPGVSEVQSFAVGLKRQMQFFIDSAKTLAQAGIKDWPMLRDAYALATVRTPPVDLDMVKKTYLLSNHWRLKE